MVDLIYNELESKHYSPESVESPGRLTSVLEELTVSSFFGEGIPADMLDELESQVLLGHDVDYVAYVKKNCEALGPEETILLDYDPAGDTYLQQSSFYSALAGIKMTIEAANNALSGNSQFVLSRPPGHHAGYDSTGGFCIFNPVAIASRYLALLGKKVLIFDFDAHQGDGTENIVRLPQANDDHYGMGLDEDTLKELEQDPEIRKMLGEIKPDNATSRFSNNDLIRFISIHQEGLYNDSGRTYDNIVNVGLPGGSGDDEFLRALDQKVAPQIASFKPDVIAVSAGFDGHELDLGYEDKQGNGVAGLNLHLTSKSYLGIHSLLREHNPFYFLEGGYNPHSILDGITAFLD